MLELQNIWLLMSISLKVLKHVHLIRLVQLPDGSQTQVTYIGTTTVSNMKLRNALYLTDFGLIFFLFLSLQQTTIVMSYYAETSLFWGPSEWEVWSMGYSIWFYTLKNEGNLVCLKSLSSNYKFSTPCNTQSISSTCNSNSDIQCHYSKVCSSYFSLWYWNSYKIVDLKKNYCF